MTEIDDALLEQWRASRYPRWQIAAHIYEMYVRGRPPGTPVPYDVEVYWALPEEFRRLGSIASAKRLLGNEHRVLKKKERVWVVA